MRFFGIYLRPRPHVFLFGLRLQEALRGPGTFHFIFNISYK